MINITFDARLERWMSCADGRLRKARLAAVVAAMYLLFSLTYLAVNEFSMGRDARTLFFFNEERLPFLPVFVYLYVLTYFVGVLVVVTVRDYDRFRRLARAAGLTLLVAYTTYLLFPVYFERPTIEASSLHAWILSVIYIDRPYNHLPSLHVALSWLAVHAAQVSDRTKAALVILTIGVSISTLFVKQHYIVDVLYGFVLAWVAWRLARPRSRRRVNTAV